MFHTTATAATSAAATIFPAIFCVLFISLFFFYSLMISSKFPDMSNSPKIPFLVFIFVRFIDFWVQK